MPQLLSAKICKGIGIGIELCNSSAKLNSLVVYLPILCNLHELQIQALSSSYTLNNNSCKIKKKINMKSTYCNFNVIEFSYPIGTFSICSPCESRVDSHQCFSFDENDQEHLFISRHHTQTHHRA